MGMTIEEATEQLKWYFECDDGTGSDSSMKKAYKVVIEALAKMKAIQEVIDMPFEWEQDDRRRYAKIVNIVRKDLTKEE